ncbi:uncharacterized protein LOC108099286 [Drosophila ficusphila]|uniref:uncharacterized protein LOC108099286 n=1 Tax=Drosophila ficusphila TaxID=30025 RepID=UPI0007E82599|nr:uncharacterized protein LOC108099286 [Drosophila ficusphila]
MARIDVSVRQGAAFLALYILLLAALVRPQMNFSIFVDTFFLRVRTSAIMVLSYRFDTFMAVVAAPLSAATVYAVSRWNERVENPSSHKMVIMGVVLAYVLVLLANVVANGVVVQKALVRFDQCPYKAWGMYRQMAMSFVESVFTDVKELFTRKHHKRPRLVYRMH